MTIYPVLPHRRPGNYRPQRTPRCNLTKTFILASQPEDGRAQDWDSCMWSLSAGYDVFAGGRLV
jgi:hypothetical protein